MKILVDENVPYAQETFGQHGDVQLFHGRKLQSQYLDGVDALIVRSITRVNAELFSQFKPAFVGTCTIGIDHLDTGYLQQQQIHWSYAPGSNAQSVVDYVLSCLASLGADNWPKSAGIVGCGNVGGLLRKQLISLGMTIKVYDPFLDSADIPELTSLSDVFSCELVCLHTPFTLLGRYPTAGMVGMDELVHLSEKAILISAGRGGVVREDELLTFLDRRPDVRIVFDVWANEPVVNSSLMERVQISTPHIAGYSQEGKRRGTEMIYHEFCDHFGFKPFGLPELPTLISDADLSFSEQLLQRYDPKVDCQLMRNQWYQADSLARDTGSWFDGLRKNYPLRRQFNS